MQITFNQNINQQCRSQKPAFKASICQATHLDSNTIKISSIPIPKSNTGVGVMTRLCDFISGITRNPENAGKTVVVDAKELENACSQCQPPFFADRLRRAFANQGVVVKNINQ